MRGRLVDATIELLAERGYNATTSTGVSERAGVSRGAQLHHFPTKNDLVVAAIEQVMSTRINELTQAAEALPSDVTRTRAVLQLFADHFTSPLFMAALELWVGARTDPDLVGKVARLEQQVGRDAHRLAVHLLEVDESVAGNRELIQATLDMIRGLGLASSISDDSLRRGRILDHWSGLLETQLRNTATASAIASPTLSTTRGLA